MTLKPPHIAFAFMALSVGLHLSLTRDSSIRFRCYPCAAVFLLAGFALIGWAWALFRRSGTPVRPGDTATALVTDGPFRFSRNPMYLSIVAILFGIASAVGTLPMLVAPVGFFLVMTFAYIPHEEQRLQALFGDTYAGYKKRVRRWI